MYLSIPYNNSRESFRFFRLISYLGFRKANIYIHLYSTILSCIPENIVKRTIDSTSRVKSRSTGFLSFVLSINRRDRQNKSIKSPLTSLSFSLLGLPAECYLVGLTSISLFYISLLVSSSLFGQCE